MAATVFFRGARHGLNKVQARETSARLKRVVSPTLSPPPWDLPTLKFSAVAARSYYKAMGHL
jgi:hypothetical protein